jgi:sugar phosphate isomerase/epimerase
MKLGISCSAILQKYGIERGFAICREAGFDTVEFGLTGYGKRELPGDIYNASQSEFEEYFTGIRALAEKAGIEIATVHGRILTYTNEEAQCEYIRWVSRKDLEAARLLGASMCVIHPIIMKYWPERIEDKDFLMGINTEMYRDLLPVAERNRVKIATETMGKTVIGDQKYVSFFARPEDILRQIEILDSPWFTVCVDTGHTNEAHYHGAVSAGDMIRAMGSNVTMLHLHDNNGTVDLHIPPLCDKRGGVDWEDVFAALEEVGYTGSYNFETKMALYGDVLEDATRFYGKYLRYFIENKGRTAG